MTVWRQKSRDARYAGHASILKYSICGLNYLKNLMTLILILLLLDVNIIFTHFHLFIGWINYKLTVSKHRRNWERRKTPIPSPFFGNSEQNCTKNDIFFWSFTSALLKSKAFVPLEISFFLRPWLTLFRIGLFGGAYFIPKKAPLSKICHRYPTFIYLFIYFI